MRKNISKGRVILLVTLMALLLALAGTYYWVETSMFNFQGTVVSPDGEPLKGLKIILFVNDEDLDSYFVLAEGVTNGNGRFRLRVKDIEEIDEAVLQVSGNDGAGRLRLTLVEETENVEVTYPIVETVVLLHDNDTHFDFNQRDAFQAKVEEIREQYDDVYLLSAGDVFVRARKKWIDYEGVIWRNNDEWYLEQSMFMINTMNKIGYDLMTAGNHEVEMIQHYTGEALAAARFPILAANVEVTTDLMPPLLPYVVLTTSTFRTIAILGLTHAVDSEVGLELDQFDTVEKYLYLSDEYDIFIGLTHIGVMTDRLLADRFPQFDVIIGGDSHTLLEEGEMVNSVLVAQAGGNDHAMSLEYPKYLGMITLTLENGRIVDKKAHVYQFEPALVVTY